MAQRRRTSTAALGYYRQTVQPELQDPALEAAQNGAYAVPPQPLLYLHGTDDGCMGADAGCIRRRAPRGVPAVER